MTKTGAQILWECLEREGVKHVFGYPGGAILPAYDALEAQRDPPHPGAPRARRHPHGRRLCARQRRVGVAVATSGPGATNMVTGIATAMLDSSPIVCITGQVGSKLIGSDAFQETDITGITLPITKHNYLVTRADELARTLREAFYVARSGRPGPVLVDITKDAQQSTCEFDWEAAKPQMPGYRPDLSPEESEYVQALELIHNAKRPVILAGHGIIVSGAMAEVLTLAEKAGVPVALTLLGLGAFPASHPLNLGMMGMHGEAWVNHTIQEADLLIALGMRFDDRVTGNLKTYAPNAKKIHIEIDPAEINKNVKVDVAAGRRSARSAASAAAARKIGGSQRVAGFNRSLERRFRGARHSEAARQRASLRRARDQRPVARDTQRQRHCCNRCRPAPDVGSAVLQAREAAFADHIRRPGDDGFRIAGGDWSQGGASGG